MSKETGGPAFPTLVRYGVVEDGPLEGNKFSERIDEGMTLRDYFAAKAMQGYLAGNPGPDRRDGYEAYAVTAYEMADAMLAERDK